MHNYVVIVAVVMCVPVCVYLIDKHSLQWGIVIGVILMMNLS